MRIGALWIETKDGKKVLSGVIDPAVGINLPAGGRLGVKIVRNENREKEKSPDYFLEAWPLTDKPKPAEQAPEALAGLDEEIPF